MNPKWYEIGLAELNTKEFAGPAHNPAVDKYFKATGVPNFTDNEAWCGAFIAWNMQQAGIKYRKATAARARDWLLWGVGIKIPAIIDSKYTVPVGAVGVIARGALGSGQGHVFMFSSWADDNHEEAFVLEGNSKDMVRIGKINTADVIGWRWPVEIPLPVAQRPAINNGIIKSASVVVIGGVTEIASHSDEIVDAVSKAKSVSTWGVIGTIVGVIIVMSAITVIVLRFKQKSDEQKIATVQTKKA